MGNLSVDPKKVKDVLFNNGTNVEKFLNSAILDLEYLIEILPGDFLYKTNVNALLTNLEDSLVKYQNIETKAYKKIDEIEGAESQNTSVFKNMILNCMNNLKSYFDMENASKKIELMVKNNATKSDSKNIDSLDPEKKSEAEMYDKVISYLNDMISDVDSNIEELNYQVEITDNKVVEIDQVEEGEVEVLDSMTLKENSDEKVELSEEKNKLLAQIQTLETTKQTIIAAITDQEYLKLQTNSDFEEYSKLDITSEEAQEVLRVMLNLDQKFAENHIEANEFLYGDLSYEEIKERFIKLGLDQYTTINWDLVESAYEKGFNYFELTLVNKDWARHCNEYIYSELQGVDATLANYNIYKLDYMTQEEIATLLYIYNKEGADAAGEYYNFKEDEINSRIGMANAIEFLDTIDPNDVNFGDYVNTTLKGLSDGSENFFEGIDAAMNGLDATLSPQQYEAMYILNGLNEMKNYLKEQGMKQTQMGPLPAQPNLSENMENFLDNFYDNQSKINAIDGLIADYEISSGIGNMLPAMAASAVVSLLATPAAGQMTGSILMGVSAGGNAAESAYQQGASYDKAVMYGFSSGVLEGVLGHYLGKIPGLSKLSKNFFINVISEGGEEALQAIIDPYLQSIILGKEFEINWEEVAKSGIYGMITAGILNGGTMVINGGVSIAVDSISTEIISNLAKAEEYGIKIDYTKIKNLATIERISNIIQKANNINHKTQEFKEIMVIAELQKSHPEIDLSKMSFEQIKNKYSSEVASITQSQFIEAVKAEKIRNAIWDAKKKKVIRDYDTQPGKMDGDFYNLSNKEQSDIIGSKIEQIELSSAEIEAITLAAEKYGTMVSNATIAKINELIADGKIKSEYSADDILRMIQDKVSQETYLTSNLVSEWGSYWKRNENGKIEVAMFQDSHAGSGNLIKYGGNIGASDGAFVIPISEYNKLLSNPEIFQKQSDGSYRCINKKLLGDELGGVTFNGDVISIIQEVDDVKMTSGDLSTAYFGEFTPGGKTQITIKNGKKYGGLVEGVVAQNKYDSDNVKIVSHGESTTQDIVNQIKTRIDINSKN